MCPPSSRNFGMARHELTPVPGQKLIEPVAGVVVDAGEHVGEPGLRIDVVELCGHDQRRHDGGAVGTTFGAGEQPGLAAESKAAQRALRRIVCQTDPPVIDEASEPVPAAQHVVDGLGDRGRV